MSASSRMILRAIVSNVSPISVISSGAFLSVPGWRMRRPSAKAAHPAPEVADRPDRQQVDRDERDGDADQPHEKRKGERARQQRGGVDGGRTCKRGAERIGASGRDRHDGVVASHSTLTESRELRRSDPGEILEHRAERQHAGRLGDGRAQDLAPGVEEDDLGIRQSIDSPGWLGDRPHRERERDEAAEGPVRAVDRLAQNDDRTAGDVAARVVAHVRPGLFEQRDGRRIGGEVEDAVRVVAARDAGHLDETHEVDPRIGGGQPLHEVDAGRSGRVEDHERVHHPAKEAESDLNALALRRRRLERPRTQRVEIGLARRVEGALRLLDRDETDRDESDGQKDGDLDEQPRTTRPARLRGPDAVGIEARVAGGLCLFGHPALGLRAMTASVA
jgi:hypothetical protein